MMVAVWISSCVLGISLYFSVELLAKAWRYVAELNSTATMEAAQIQADAYRYAADAQHGGNQPPDEPPPPLPENVAIVEKWATERFGEGPEADDIVGMFEVCAGHVDGTLTQKEEYLARLQKIGVPLDLHV